MKPDHYSVSTEGRHRLKGMMQKRGTKPVSTSVGSFVGIPFMAVGIFIGLIGAKVIEVDPSTVHAPYWVLIVFGICFALAGFGILGTSLKQFAANRQRLRASRQYPNDPVLASAFTEYPWHPDGFVVSEWPGVAKSTVLALALPLFLSMFNWWAFVAHGPWPVKAIVVVFDCVALYVLWYVATQLGRALKFGKSRILFASFPCRLPGPITIRWQPEGGVDQIRKGTFTLRCVEERVEVTGSRNNRNQTLVHEEIWSATWALEKPRNFPMKETMELVYELPSDALTTQLNAIKATYWELEVKLDLPGLDFKQTYLVPIYGAKAASQQPAITA